MASSSLPMRWWVAATKVEGVLRQHLVVGLVLEVEEMVEVLWMRQFANVAR